MIRPFLSLMLRVVLPALVLALAFARIADAQLVAYYSVEPSTQHVGWITDNDQTLQIRITFTADRHAGTYTFLTTDQTTFTVTMGPVETGVDTNTDASGTNFHHFDGNAVARFLCENLADPGTAAFGIINYTDPEGQTHDGLVHTVSFHSAYATDTTPGGQLPPYVGQLVATSSLPDPTPTPSPTPTPTGTPGPGDSSPTPTASPGGSPGSSPSDSPGSTPGPGGSPGSSPNNPTATPGPSNGDPNGTPNGTGTKFPTAEDPGYTPDGKYGDNPGEITGEQVNEIKGLMDQSQGMFDQIKGQGSRFHGVNPVFGVPVTDRPYTFQIDLGQPLGTRTIDFSWAQATIAAIRGISTFFILIYFYIKSYDTFSKMFTWFGN